MINESLKNEKVCFYVNVLSYKNELLIAYESGGYKSTGIYFTSNNFGECCETSEKLSEKVFGLTKSQCTKLISKSMFSKTN